LGTERTAWRDQRRTALQTLTCDLAARPDRRALRSDGPITAKAEVYIAQFRPALKPGDMVIMDTPGSHKGYAVRRAIRRRASVPAALQSSNPAAHRRPAQLLHTTGVRQLTSGICCHLNGKRF
jgi:hypothetical protein